MKKILIILLWTIAAVNSIAQVTTVHVIQSDLNAQLALKGALGSANTWTSTNSFTGNITLPSATTIGSVTATELTYLSGVTSSIQTQIASKANSSQLTSKASTVSNDFTGINNFPLLGLTAQPNGNIFTPSGGLILYSNSSNVFGWKSTNGFFTTLNSTANTADQVYNLPNASGMIPLLQSTQTFSGVNTFTSIVNVKNAAGSDAATLGSNLTTTGSGTNWTGTSFSAGYTHTVGSVAVLTSTFFPSIASSYYIVYTISGRTAGSVDIGFGGTTTLGVTATTSTVKIPTTTTALAITPTTDFDGVIAVTINLITEATSGLSLSASNASVFSEFRGSNSNNNLGVGFSSLMRNVGGFSNAAFGQYSLYSNISGSLNAALGTGSLQNNTTGTENAALGYRALYGNLSGSSNVGIGREAGRYTSSFGENMTTSNSIYIGTSTKSLGTGNSGEIVIGYQGQGLGSNTTAIGNSNTTFSRIFGNLGIGTSTNSGYNLDVVGTSRLDGNTISLTSSKVAIDNGASPWALRLYTGGMLSYGQTINIFAGSTGDGQSSGVNFGTTLASVFSTKASIFPNGNFLINTVTDAGFKLDVNGTARIQGDATLLGALTVSNNFTAGAITSNRFTVNAANIGIASNLTTPLKFYIPNFTNTDASTAASGTVAHTTNFVLGQPTLASSNTLVTNTIASNLYIGGPPIAGTNTTITNAYSLYVNSGNSYFGGQITGTNIGLSGDIAPPSDGQGNLGTNGFAFATVRGVNFYTENLRERYGGSNISFLKNDGTTLMKLLSSGSLGVGTTTPDTKIHIHNTDTSPSFLTVSNSLSKALIGVGSVGETLIGSYGQNIIKFGYNLGTTLVETMRINSIGNVGIGTTAPTTKLHIDKQTQTIGSTIPSGAIVVSDLTGGNYALELGSDATKSNYIQSRNVTNNTSYNLLINPSGGNVGVGSISPATKLEVSDPSTTQIRAIMTSTGGADTRVVSDNGYGAIGTYSASTPLYLMTTGAVRATITSTGSLGINTTAPTAQFHVAQSPIASVSSGNGTANSNVVTVLGGSGGSSSTATGSVSAGKGGGINMTAGVGGFVTGVPTSGFAGNGGDISLDAGIGGNSSGTTNYGGSGGYTNLSGGTGGIGTINSGNGGYVSLKGGNAAAAGNSSGGNVYIVGGTANGTGTIGDVYLGMSPSSAIRGSIIIGANLNYGYKFDVTGTSRFNGSSYFNGNVGIGIASPTSTLHNTGSEASNIIIITTATTLVDNHYVIADGASTYLVTLPSASTCVGRVYAIKTLTANKTISAFLNLNGTSTTTLTLGTVIYLISDGTNWQQF